MYKSRLIWLILVWLSANTGLAAPSDLIARIHFAGSATISSDPEFPAFNNFFCSTNAQALELQTLDKLGHYPRAWIGNRASLKVGEGYPQIRPLLDDFIHSEWYLEARDSVGIAPEFALAIHLSDDRAKLWERNTAMLLTSWTALTTQSIPGGWWLKKDLPPDSIRFLRVGEWVVLSCEQGKFLLGDAFMQQIKATQRPVAALKNEWLSVDADWTRLARYFPGLQPLDLPKTSVQLTGKNGDICWNGKLDFAQPLPAYGNWQIPTNDVHQPIISFTAARGINTWLQQQSWAQRYLTSPVPNQMLAWVAPGSPFMSYVAVPVPDAKSALLQLNSALSTPAKAGAAPANPFMFSPHTVLTNNQITLQGFPFASPFIQAQHELNGDFIYGGFFPNPVFNKPLQPELLNAMTAKNLVFYHWEMTSIRLKMLPQLAQLMLILSQHRQLAETSLADKWLNQIGPTLGNSTTMGVQTGPNDVSFTRQARGGLTATELFALACWLEAPDFPGCNLKMPPMRHPVRPNPQMQSPKTPMPLLTH